MYPSLVFKSSFVSFFFLFFISLPFLFILVFLSCLETSFLSVFLAIFPDVVETSSNLASDAAGVAGHTAPKSADAGIPAHDLAPANAGEVVETHPQIDANAPLQLIREICNRVSYPHASKFLRG